MGDALLFLFANVIAVVVTTPLDVIRTQMILGNRSVQDLPSVVRDLYEKRGIDAFLAGLAPRVVYNGFIIGVLFGFVRQGCDGVRARFLLDVVDRLEDVASFQDLLRFLLMGAKTT